MVIAMASPGLAPARAVASERSPASPHDQTAKAIAHGIARSSAMSGRIFEPPRSRRARARLAARERTMGGIIGAPV